MAATLGAVADLLGVTLAVDRDREVVDVTHDSRDVVRGSLFVAIRGSTHDGHDHVAGASDRGAIGVIVEHDVPVRIPQLLVADARLAMAPTSRLVHGFPDRSLSIVGVTGTNGKTTVTHLCESVWRAANRPCGVLGTLGARYGDVPIPLARTTPESSDTQRILATMRDAGVASVAMEVSSHALALHRADAIAFRAVGFTNLTQDHLDFHHTMDAYFDAKLSLFTRSRADVAVVHTDTEAGRAVAEATDLRVVRVGFDPRSDVTAIETWSTPTDSEFSLATPSGTVRVRLPLVGSFNIANALVAAGLLLEDGVELDAIAEGFSALHPVAGRMEVVEHDGPFTVIVDYAHTPDAITAVLTAVSATTDGRIIALVGAGGDRDAAKRESMGAATARLADITIVTTDNPRSEDPLAIASAVAAGAERVSGASVRTVLPRREAIADAIDLAAPGDIVMILGRGHEQHQEVAGVMHPFDDRSVARDALRDAGWVTT